LLIVTNNKESLNGMSNNEIKYSKFSLTDIEFTVSNNLHTVFLIDDKFEEEKDIDRFIKSIIEANKKSFGKINVIIVSDKENVTYNLEANESIKVIRIKSEDINSIINMLYILKDECLDLGSFLDSLEGHLIFNSSFKIENVNEISSYLGQNIVDKKLNNADIKILIAFPEGAIENNEKNSIEQNIKELNNYSEIEFLPIMNEDYNRINIFCLYNNVPYLKFYSNIENKIIDESLRYIRFTNDINTSDIFIIDNNFKIDYKSIKEKNNLLFPVFISVDENINAQIVIPEKYIKSYLQMLDIFMSPKYSIGMIDVSDILRVNGTLVSYYRFNYTEDIVKQIEEKLKTDKSINNIIFYSTKPYTTTFNEVTKSIKNILPEVNAIYFYPKKVYGEQEYFIDIFAFKK
jgi:hypothetical protein